MPKRGKATPRYLLKLQQEVDAMQQIGASFDAVYLRASTRGSFHCCSLVPISTADLRRPFVLPFFAMCRAAYHVPCRLRDKTAKHQVCKSKHQVNMLQRRTCSRTTATSTWSWSCARAAASWSTSRCAVLQLDFELCLSRLLHISYEDSRNPT